jgi:hypothetical protein
MLTDQQVDLLCDYGNSTYAPYLKTATKEDRRQYAFAYHIRHPNQAEIIFRQYGTIEPGTTPTPTVVPISLPDKTILEAKDKELKKVTGLYTAYSKTLQDYHTDHNTMQFIAVLPSIIPLVDQESDAFDLLAQEYNEYQAAKKNNNLKPLQKPNTLLKSRKMLLKGVNAEKVLKDVGGDDGKFFTLLSFVKKTSEKKEIPLESKSETPTNKTEISNIQNELFTPTTKTRSSNISKSPFKTKTNNITEEEEIDLSE